MRSLEEFLEFFPEKRFAWIEAIWDDLACDQGYRKEIEGMIEEELLSPQIANALRVALRNTAEL